MRTGSGFFYVYYTILSHFSLPLAQKFSVMGLFVPQGTYLETFKCHDWEKGRCYSTEREETRDDAKHPKMQRVDSYNRVLFSTKCQ